MKHIIFDVMAVLINLALKYETNRDDTAPLTEDEEDILTKKINNILNAIDEDDDFSQAKDAIIKACKDEDDYSFICEMLDRLDSMVNIDEVLKQYDFTAFSYSIDHSVCFEGLNHNIEETSIIILPRVKTLKACSNYKNPNGEYTDKANAHSFLMDLNPKLKKTYYVKTEELKKHNIRKINNIITSPSAFLSKDKKTIRIGASPICKIPMNDLFDLDFYTGNTSNGKHKTQLFSVKKLYHVDEIVRKVTNSFNKACELECDIYIAPEMLGTAALLETEEGLSPIFRPSVNNGYNTPFLTLAPTEWSERKNVLTIFNENGEKIGIQHKQNSFEISHKGRMWQEDLSNSNAEILIIHVDKIGRFAFPICRDYLVEPYRRFMTSVLKATFLFCPSFSPGAYNFDISIDADSEFEVRSLWINSCSANTEHPSEYIGLISLPTSSEQSRRQRLKPKCGDCCYQTCLFVIDIPIDNKRQDLEATIDHITE